jgi:hypothetical protein
MRLKAGDLLWVFQENDPHVMYTKPQWKRDWAERSMGQMAEVTVVREGVVRIRPALRLDYPLRRRPQIRIADPVEDAGVEHLHLKRLDHLSKNFLVRMNISRRCWVRDCETELCNRVHVAVHFCYRNTVEGCYLHHAWGYTGGYGYGVSAARCSTDCLVTNNAFFHLRHAMMIKEGACGNVFSYNASYENHGVDGGKARRKADLCAHGHYPCANLFEGNVVQLIANPDWWGPSGPHNTFFRNRVVQPRHNRGALEVMDHTRRTNVVGNTLLTGGLYVHKSCQETLVLGNLVEGNARAGELEGLPASLYLTGKPAFWDGGPWPAIGADVDARNPENMHPTPALTRLKALTGKN